MGARMYQRKLRTAWYEAGDQGRLTFLAARGDRFLIRFSNLDFGRTLDRFKSRIPVRERVWDRRRRVWHVKRTPENVAVLQEMFPSFRRRVVYSSWPGLFLLVVDLVMAAATLEAMWESQAAGVVLGAAFWWVHSTLYNGIYLRQVLR